MGEISKNLHTTTLIGNRGEALAAEWLASHGFEILHRNWRHWRDELDIVARRGEVLHFVEVKTRKKHGLTSPEKAVDREKSRTMLQAVGHYLEQNPFDGELQFDLIAVRTTPTGHDIRYIENAIEPHWV